MKTDCGLKVKPGTDEETNKKAELSTFVSHCVNYVLRSVVRYNEKVYLSGLIACQRLP